MSYLEAFHARTSAPPEKGLVSPESDQDSGQKWHGLLAKFDPATCSWKTAQCSLFEDSEPSLETWPRWGSMRNGACWVRPTLAHRTSGNASGLWPTPVADGDRTTNYAQGGTSLGYAVRNWPTPTAFDAHGVSSLRKDNNIQKGGRHGVSLNHAVMWPTATATAYKGWSPNHNRADTDNRLDYTVEREAYQSGQQTPPLRLNPVWVEWLMGWPLGWTDLKPLEMGKFQEWQQQHSACSETDMGEAA